MKVPRDVSASELIKLLEVLKNSKFYVTVLG